MALGLQHIAGLQGTTDRFAKSTQHLLSNLSKSLASIHQRKTVHVDDTELSDEEYAIRCQINFERLLHKTLVMIQNIDTSILDPHRPPLLLRVQRYYKTLESEFRLLAELASNARVHLRVDNHAIESQMSVVKEWMRTQTEIAKQSTQKQKKEQQQIERKLQDKNRDAHRKEEDGGHIIRQRRRRVMRFSEKLAKEYEEKRVNNLKQDGSGSASGSQQQTKKLKKTDEFDERQQLISELASMTGLLKHSALGLRKTLQTDQQYVEQLDEKTEESLDNVSALNERLTKYVESTSGMTCTMCLMVFTVIATWIWCFFIIYFV